MIDTIQGDRAHNSDRAHNNEDRQIGGWRVVVCAWGLVLLALLLLAGVGAVACPRSDHQPHRYLAAAVIPQHDPCVGPSLASAADVDGCKVIPLGQTAVSYDGYW